VNPTPKNLRSRLGTLLANFVELAALGRTSGELWQVLGLENRAADAAAFQGVGVTARPPEGRGQAVVLYPGDGSEPIVVATTDPGGRFQVEADETAVHNTMSVCHFKADGTVEIRSRDGTAVSLATKADLQAVYDAIATTWVPVAGDGGTSLKTLFQGLPGPAGTTKLKGE